MRIAIAGGALLAAAALCTVPMGTAHAQLAPEPITSFFGNEDATPNLVAGKPGAGNQATNAVTIVYDNSTAASSTVFGFSSLDLAAQFGDELFTTGTGVLSTNKFSIFNSPSSAGPLTGVTVQVSFFNAVTSALLGSYSTSVTFSGTGLGLGGFSAISVSGLDPLLILLSTTDVVVIQTVTAKTGAATRLGIASRNPPTVGSSPITMFINATDVPGSPAFFTINTPPIPANPIYMIGVSPPPVGVKSKSWSELKKLYR
jgi:hypothetical protein